MEPAATLTVDVTREDIAHGVPGDGCLCPLASATLRIPGIISVDIGINDMWVLFNAEPNKPQIYVLPKAAVQFVTAFDEPDKYGTVEPFTFTATIQE